MYWHLTLSSARRDNLFPTREHRVHLARQMTRVRAPVLLFCAVDDHLHTVVEGERPHKLGGALVRALSRQTEVAPAHLQEVSGRRHLLRLVDYLLGQPAKHDLGVHPALWEGSCFPDLVGARAMGFDRGPLQRALPRLHHRDFIEAVGLRTTPRPLSWEEVEALGPQRILAAVEASAGLDSLVGTRSADRVRAREVAAWMCARVGIGAERIAEPLGVSVRSVRRLRGLAEEPSLGRATRTWLHLERLCGQ